MERKKKTFIPKQSSVRDYADPKPMCDCQRENARGSSRLMHPWIAICSTKHWGEEAVNPDGLADGDLMNPEYRHAQFDMPFACDIEGRPYYLNDESEPDVYSGYEDLDEEVDQMLYEEELLAEERRMFLVETAEDEEVPVVAYPEPSTEPFFRHEEEKVVVTVGGVKFAGPHPLEALPSREPASHVIASGRAIESRKVIRRSYDSGGSYPNGKRGTDKYKDRRRRAQQVVEF